MFHVPHDSARVKRAIAYACRKSATVLPKHAGRYWLHALASASASNLPATGPPAHQPLVSGSGLRFGNGSRYLYLYLRDLTAIYAVSRDYS